MRTERTSIADARLLVPTVHADARGSFRETYRTSISETLGLRSDFVQENISESTRGALRGLHYMDGMAKLTQVVHGATYHVIADMRPDSPTYRQWQAFEFSHEAPVVLYVPPGVANGFYVRSDRAYVHYKQTRYYDPTAEHRVRWNDPALAITWPTTSPLLSDLDRNIPNLAL